MTMRFLKLIQGTRANLLFSQCTILRRELSATFRAECLRFYQISTKYLKDNLPINVKAIKHAQYLHHEKQLHPYKIHAIANLALKITNLLNGLLASVFKMEGSREEIVDKIRFQWSQYQLEDITEDFYLKPHVENITSPVRPSYWAYALQLPSKHQSLFASMRTGTREYFGCNW